VCLTDRDHFIEDIFSRRNLCQNMCPFSAFKVWFFFCSFLIENSLCTPSFLFTVTCPLHRNIFVFTTSTLLDDRIKHKSCLLVRGHNETRTNFFQRYFLVFFWFATEFTESIVMQWTSLYNVDLRSTPHYYFIYWWVFSLSFFPRKTRLNKFTFACNPQCAWSQVFENFRSVL
jgi:hypothetical protein